MPCDTHVKPRNNTTLAVRRSVLSVLICSALMSAHAQDSVTVFWVGNSLTATGNIPDTTAAMVNRGSSQQETVIGSFDESFLWGQTLAFHWHNSSDSSQIAESHYDYVILQDFVPYNQDTVYHYYDKFTQVVDSSGGTPVVAGIWPPYGSAPAQWYYFIGFLNRVAETYDAVFAPLASAWWKVLEDDPDYPLYAHAYDTTDTWHQSRYGAYLCACVYYYVFTGNSPVGNSVTGGLSTDTAAYLQLKAWDVCDSIQSILAIAPLAAPDGVRHVSVYEYANERVEHFDLRGRAITRAVRAGRARLGLALSRTVLPDGRYHVIHGVQPPH